MSAGAGPAYLSLSIAGAGNQRSDKEASAMNDPGLILLGVTFGVIVSTWLWRRYRRARLPLVSRAVRCPLHDCRAEVTVRVDPDGHPRRRHADVVACSLLSDAAVALPERRAYLPDAPPCSVVMDAARAHAVPAAGVSCRQPCVFVLNAAASSDTPHALVCASGVSDGIDLMRQADRLAAGIRPLWYDSM
jgi:hypothetical protein